MIQDLHSHTYYSFCGKDKPTELIETAIRGGIELFGISDHSYGVGLSRQNAHDLTPLLQDFQRSVNAYFDHLTLLKEKYASQINIKLGIEIPTLNRPYLLLPEGLDLSMFDFCLLEHIDAISSICYDLFDFADKCGCKKVGIAHTNLPKFLDRKGIDRLDYFKKMAENDIFWEINVNYDSIHSYNEHAYVKEFFEDKELQDIVRRSGVKLSVGFDGHKIEDYLPERVRQACEKISELKIPLVYE